MLDTIMSFAEDVFTNEVLDNIRKAFSLFEAFEYQAAYEGLYEVATDESVSSTESRMDHFSIELCSQLDCILDQHLIKLTNEATLKHRLIVLDALYRIQHLESYAAIDAILGTEEDSIDKFSMILDDLTEYDQGYFLVILKEVDRRMLFLLEKLVTSKQTSSEVAPVSLELVNRIKLFDTVFGTHHVGHAMVAAGMTVGYPFSTYLPFVQSDMIDVDQELTALNILSVLYVSDTLSDKMIQTFREVSEKLMPLDTAGKVESFLIKQLGRLSDQSKVQHEQNRLSEKGIAGRSGE